MRAMAATVAHSKSRIMRPSPENMAVSILIAATFIILSKIFRTDAENSPGNPEKCGNKRVLEKMRKKGPQWHQIAAKSTKKRSQNAPQIEKKRDRFASEKKNGKWNYR